MNHFYEEPVEFFFVELLTLPLRDYSIVPQRFQHGPYTGFITTPNFVNSGGSDC